MTPVICIIIVVLIIVLFVTNVIPGAVTAVLGCLLLALTGVCSFADAFSGFSNSTVVLMFGMMVLGIAMEDTGVAKLIGAKVTAVSSHNERLFIFLAGTTSAVLSTFLTNTAVISIFLPIIASIAKSDKQMKRMNLTLPVTMGAMFGGVCTLVGSTPQLTANGILLEISGRELGMFDYTLPGIIIFAVYMLYVETVGYYMGKKIWGVRENDIEEDETKDKLPESNIEKRKIIILFIIFAAMIVSYIGEWISVQLTSVIVAMLCLITGCTTQKNVFKKMNWSVVFVLAGCLGMASGITKSGAADLLGNALSSVIDDHTAPFVIFAVFVVATMLISNFITNSTAVMITLPIALPLCNAIGLNPASFTLGIVFAANLTFSTPLANAQTAMTLVAGYKFSDYIKYTWLLDLLVLASILIVIPLYMPLR